MVEGAVDDGVGFLGAAVAERARVLEVAPVCFGARRRERVRPCVGAGETEHQVPGLEELRDELRADEAGCAGEEDSHGFSLVPVVGQQVRCDATPRAFSPPFAFLVQSFTRPAVLPAMDPLSEVLSLLRPSSYAAGGFGHGKAIFPSSGRSTTGSSAGRPPRAGECWLVVEGTGDLLALPSGGAATASSCRVVALSA